MKKFLLFAAACVALLACDTEDVNQPEFVGRQVTLSATVDLSNAQNAPIRMVAPDASSLASTTATFHWEAGDQVMIKNASGTSTFTIVDSSINGNKADFTGEALSDMSSYDVYYGYASEDITAVQDLPYLKDSTFRPFIQGTGNSTGFNLNQFLPVLKLKIVGGLMASMSTTTLDSIVYKIGANRNVAQTKAKMTLPAGLTLSVSDSIPVYFPVPQANS